MILDLKSDSTSYPHSNVENKTMRIDHTPNAIYGFRGDISGIRAIAVILVLLFHMKLTDWGGGFVGVDIFFVVSGYLILPRLNMQCANGNFRYSDFIGKRIRRLLPAILPVLLFVVIFGLLFFGDGAFKGLLESTLAASTFVSNVYFENTRGYFERGTDLMLLLHTWSLGVEFQFYLLTPILFVLAGRFRIYVLVILTVLSFVFSCYLVSETSPQAYYGIGSRFWELGLGGLLGIFHPRSFERPDLIRQKIAGLLLRFSGLAVIIFTAMSYSSSTSFPGAFALFPTLGACLLIAAPNTKYDPILWLLQSRGAQWIGDRSYSIYLWHWPLLLALDSSKLFGEIKDGHRAGAILLTVFLAHFSYRFLEIPVQRLPSWKNISRVCGLALTPGFAILMLLTLERYAGALSGARAHLPHEQLRAINSLADPARLAYLKDLEQIGVNGENGLCSLDAFKTVENAALCLSKSTGNGDTLVIGDSHGRDMFITLRKAFPEIDFHMLHQTSCAPASYASCFQSLGSNLPNIISEGGYKSVVLASHWPPSSLDALEVTIETLQSLNIYAVIIGAGPVFESDITQILADTNTDIDRIGENEWITVDFRFDVASVDQRLRETSGQNGIGFVSRLAYLCADSNCLGFVPGTTELMLFDNQHLTQAGMEFLADRFRTDPVLQQLGD